MPFLRLWLHASRATFFTATIIPVLLGASVAWYDYGIFDWWLLILSLAGAILLHAFTNLANDYFDYQSGNDSDNPHRSAFNGGAGLLQEGTITPGQVLRVAYLCLAVVLLIAIYLSAVRGWVVMLLGLTGAVSGWIYTASPFSAVYHSWGELLVGINFGPLLVSGAYFVQTQSFSSRALLVSAPMGLLVAAILYINQFADYDADRKVGKKTLIVRLGPQRAVIGAYLLFLAVFLIVFGGVLLRALPLTTLGAILALPLSWRACRVTARYYAIPPQMLPASKATVSVQLIIGILLSAAFVSARLLAL